MEEKIIGLVYRFGKNDYQISLMDFDDKDQDKLMIMEEKYSNKCSCERGDMNLTLKDANVEYWESNTERKEFDKRRLELAHELYELGFKETDVFYDDQADEQLTEEQIADALNNYKDAAYTLEAVLQWCNDGTDKDHDKFFEASMKIVRHMEELAGMKGEN